MLGGMRLPGLTMRPMTETEWKNDVMSKARSIGWMAFHANDSRRQVRDGTLVGDSEFKGFPDCMFIRGERLVFAELKNDTRKLTPEQWLTLRALEATGLVETYVWRPKDAAEVLAVLTSRATPAVRSNLTDDMMPTALRRGHEARTKGRPSGGTVR